MPASLRTWCTVSFSALRFNLRTLRRAAPKGTRILAVVKDNAYGHGLVPVARALSRAGCEEFGVAFASEGAELRQAGIREPILLLGSSLPSEFPAALAHRLTVTLSSLQEAGEFARAAQKARTNGLVQAKLDTGMNRLGAKPAEFQKLLAYLHRHPRLALVEPSPTWPAPARIQNSPVASWTTPSFFPSSVAAILPTPPPPFPVFPIP